MAGVHGNPLELNVYSFAMTSVQYSPLLPGGEVTDAPDGAVHFDHERFYSGDATMRIGT